MTGGLAAAPFAGPGPRTGPWRRLGWPDGFGLDGALVELARRLPATRPGGEVLRLPSAGVLRDHLDAGLLDAALLPLSAPGLVFAERAALPLPPAEAWLLLGPAQGTAAPVLARPAADREADAALLALWGAVRPGGGAATLLALAPGPALANVAAGRLAAALVFGGPPPLPAGCRLVPLGRHAPLRPHLGFAVAAFADA